MNIRAARKEDVERILELYEHARMYMRQEGNRNQWVDGYPSREDVMQDLKDGTLYVVEENGMVEGVFAYILGDDPTYAYIEDGAWPDDDPYGTVHRIASSGNVKGIGKFCFDWCLKQCPNVRIDTHKDNKTMLNLLEKEGFQYCGIIYTMDHSPRKAYEKKRWGL